MAEGPVLQIDSPALPVGTHVLHVAESATLSRLSVMHAQLLPGLAAQGLRVSLLTNHWETIDRLEDTPVECHGIEFLSGWRAWRLAKFLASRFSTPPNLVHVWGRVSLTRILRWAHTARTPVIAHVTGEADVAVLVRRDARGPAGVASFADALLEPLGERRPELRARRHVIPPGVALPIRSRVERGAQRTLGVLCVGELDAGGGLGVLVDALALLRQKDVDVQAVAVGSGPGLAGAWTRIRQAGVQAALSVLDVPRLWEQAVSEADVLVVPARESEVWLAPLYAMGVGVPVVASRDQPCPWYLEDVTSWQFTPGSAVELAYVLTRVIEQPRHVAALRQSAAEYVRAHHALGDMLQALVACYVDVLGEAAEADVTAGSPGEEPAHA